VSEDRPPWRTFEAMWKGRMAFVFGAMTAIVDLPYIVMQREQRLAYAAANGVALIAWVVIGFAIGAVIDHAKRRQAWMAELQAMTDPRIDAFRGRG